MGPPVLVLNFLKGLFGTYPILECVTSCPGYLNLGIAVDYYINNFNYASRQPVLTNGYVTTQ